MLMERIEAPTYSQVVRAVLRSVAELQRKSRLATKYPLFWRCTDLLESLFPGVARYLWIVRDGRDAALSLMKQPWGQRSTYACARHWMESLNALDAFQRRMDSTRLLVIRYEDLLMDPLATLSRVDAFVDARLANDHLSAIADRIRASPLATNFGKWRTSMTPEDHRVFEGIAGEGLDKFGYARLASDPRVRWYEHVRYTCAEYLRRAGRMVAPTT
jgi:hypothetical protein